MTAEEEVKLVLGSLLVENIALKHGAVELQKKLTEAEARLPKSDDAAKQDFAKPSGDDTAV